MCTIRYEINYLAPRKRRMTRRQRAMQRLQVLDHSHAAHEAVRLATAGCFNILVTRFDPATGWDIVGRPRVYDAHRPGQPPTVLYQDARTLVQALEDGVQPPRGRRSGMRVFGAALPVDRKPALP